MTIDQAGQTRTGVRYSPLADQFADVDEVFEELRALVRSGDFTLGRVVSEFEAQFAEAVGTRYAIGVGSGTDALKIPLKALDVGPGDEVITCANTFWATCGAIAEVGARSVFVDCDDSFCIDTDRIAEAITPRTKAIVPVHLTGEVADMAAVMAIAERHGLAVVEDACQSLLGEIDGRRAGTIGAAAAFSMHPLKIINVWGDAGIVVTNDEAIDRQCRLLRNHGLVNRDEMVILGYNSRLDSTQAVVGKWILAQVHDIVDKRIRNAAYLDAALSKVPGIRLPPRNPRTRNVHLFYIFFAEQRDELLRHCLDRGVEAKIHYPIPIYQQQALAHLGYQPGDFPVTDRHAKTIVSLPVDQHLSRDQLDTMIGVITEFYVA